MTSGCSRTTLSVWVTGKDSILTTPKQYEGYHNNGYSGNIGSRANITYYGSPGCRNGYEQGCYEEGSTLSCHFGPGYVSGPEESLKGQT